MKQIKNHYTQPHPPITRVYTICNRMCKYNPFNKISYHSGFPDWSSDFLTGVWDGAVQRRCILHEQNDYRGEELL